MTPDHPLIQAIARAIEEQEGGLKPGSINWTMSHAEPPLWNTGHLVWANQREAVPVFLHGRNWAGWPTREAAFRGICRDVCAKIHAFDDSLSSLIHRYAPPCENNTLRYIAFVAHAAGIDNINQPLKELA